MEDGCGKSQRWYSALLGPGLGDGRDEVPFSYLDLFKDMQMTKKKCKQ